MQLTQNFSADFVKLTTAIAERRPFALSRFADGERAFCAGYKKGTSADGWRYDGTDTKLALSLRKAVTASIPGYFLGLSCYCCDPAGSRWYQANIKTPLSRQTFSNIFVNANYGHFQEFVDANRLRDEAVMVGSCEDAEIKVPRNAINPAFDYSATLAAMVAAKDRVILVAAGPLSCVLIHEFWQNPDNRDATIVDIGSALDECTHGRKTRRYQHHGSPTSGKVCKCYLPPEVRR